MLLVGAVAWRFALKLPVADTRVWPLWQDFLHNGQESFLAGFSNRGAKVAPTAPGVGVVSTIFGSRWGVMSGTSMATPIATGVLARRLAASPTVKDLPRDAARSAEIVKMALQAAEDIHLPAGMQGKGLAR